MNKAETERVGRTYLELLLTQGLSFQTMKEIISAINDVDHPNRNNQIVMRNILRMVLINDFPLEAPIFIGLIKDV